MRIHGSLIAALGLTAFLAMPIAAQAGGSMTLGFKGGATFSKISVEDDEDIDLDYLTGFGGGAFLSIALGGVALQPEALYVRKGVSASGADFDGAELGIRLDYLEIPVLLVVPVGSGAGASPYVFGGGAIAFEVGCTFQLESEIVSADVDCDEAGDFDLELQRKDMDYSAVFGAGLRIPSGRGAFLLEGRYTLGLADLSDSNDSNDGFKNRSIAAFLGYSIPLGN